MTDETLPEKFDKQELLIRNLCLGMNVTQAASQAGYSDSTAQSSVYQMIKQPKFQARLKEYVLAHNIIDIPKVISLENKAIDALTLMFESDPDKAIDKLAKLSPTFKRKLQDAGVSQSDQQPAQQTINVKNLQNFMVQVTAERQKAIEGEVVE